MSAQWDPVSAWSGLVTDEVDGTSSLYSDLLTEGSVAYIERPSGDGPGFWGVFGRDEVAKAASDLKAFSSRVNLTGPPVLPLEIDQPQHSGFRKLLNPFFTQKETLKHEDTVRDYAAEMLDALIAEGEADFSEEFASPFPIRVLCSFMAVPDEDWRIIHAFVTQDAVRQTADPDRPMREAQADSVMPYLQHLVTERRSAPGEDVISGIIAGEIDGAPLPDEAVIGLFLSIAFGGQDTTRRGLSNLVLRMARDAQLQAFLRANPDRIADAVEESLRLDSPQQAMPRRCIQDTVVGGQEIKVGEYVWLNFGSANVDPKHWAEPGKFDIDRPDKRHMGLGRGIHQCIGLNMAKMEMRVVAEELLSRTDSFSVPGAVTRTAWPELGVTSMQIVMEPRSQ